MPRGLIQSNGSRARLYKSPCHQDACSKASENLRMPFVTSQEQFFIVFKICCCLDHKEAEIYVQVVANGICRSVGFPVAHLYLLAVTVSLMAEGRYCCSRSK